MQKILDALVAPDFIRSLIILLVTAALTGVLVPQIAAKLSEQRNRRQKLFEAELTRQRDVLTAQAELLKNLSKLAWRFQLLNINVSFCKLGTGGASYTKAVEKYQTESAELLGQLRAEISTSRHLVSQPMQEKLRTLYFEVLLAIDSSLERLIALGSRAKEGDWREQHDRSFGAAQSRIEDTLAELAHELKLTSPVSGA